MDKMREEFEAWANDYIGIDCEAMPYGKFDDDMEPQYHNESDPDGALIVSSMFAAWKASRAVLCVELPSRQTVICGTDLLDKELVEQALDAVGVLYT